MSSHDAVTETELRAAWRRLHMVGNYEASMQHGAVRRAVESAARAMRARAHRRERDYADNKRRAANDADD
ncbi:MAG: hypothetical protein ACTHKH_16920 [Trinickia sp.]|jgi:hypothetical protein